jgi:4-hydroxy-L-threonine phosphate dehydrogenase PdxA
MNKSEADAMLQTKNVRATAINEHITLKKEVEKRGISTDDIHKLLNVLINAKRYGFDGKEIAEKL